MSRPTDSDQRASKQGCVSIRCPQQCWGQIAIGVVGGSSCGQHSRSAACRLAILAAVASVVSQSFFEAPKMPWNENCCKCCLREFLSRTRSLLRRCLHGTSAPEGAYASFCAGRYAVLCCGSARADANVRRVPMRSPQRVRLRMAHRHCADLCSLTARSVGNSLANC